MINLPLPITSFEACLAYLRVRLSQNLPGVAAQTRMAPSYRPTPSQLAIAEKACREAGVMALLFPQDEVPTLLLTVRRSTLPHHPGQISFPGGRREAMETLQQTALRETFEEVGLVPETINILGSLTPLYIPPSNFCVYPFLGSLLSPPQPIPDHEEVEALLHAPLPLLFDPTYHRREPRQLLGRTVEVPYLDIAGHKVWGATAMMIAELLALFTDDGFESLLD